MKLLYIFFRWQIAQQNETAKQSLRKRYHYLVL